MKPKRPKRWTYAAFYKLLPKSGWYLRQGQKIRSNSNCGCPIEFVAHVLHGGDFQHQIVHAEAAIGLTAVMAARIISAADNPHAPRRAELLKACGLKEGGAE